MQAEIPQDLAAVNGFFKSQGWRAATILNDWQLQQPLKVLAETGAIETVPVADLLAETELWRRPAPAWDRTEITLLNRKDELQGLALLSPMALEAALIYQPAQAGGEIKLWRLGYRKADPGLPYLSNAGTGEP